MNFDPDVAERLVLGAILMNNSVLDQSIALLKPSHFQRHSYRRIYQEMVAMHERREPVELGLLHESLRGAHELERVGGTEMLSSLIDDVVQTDDLGGYAAIIRGRAKLRAIATAAETISQLCESGEPVNEIEEKAQKLLQDATGGFEDIPWLPLVDAARRYGAEIDRDAMRGDGLTGMPTGLTALDYHLLGLQRGELIVLAGRPSQGKTTLGFDIARRVARSGHKVAFFSLEMGHTRIAEKALAADMRMNSWELRRGRLTGDEWSLLIRVTESFSDVPIWICDDPRVSPARVRAKVRRLVQCERQIDVIVVDYLGLMELPAGRFDKRYELLGQAVIRMKQLAREFNASVLLLHQLNREVEKRNSPEPQLSDLAESGDIEKHCDVALFIYREGETTKLKFGKNRNGPTGIADLIYLKEQNRFENPYV